MSSSRCQRPGCGAEVAWSDAEFHHVDLHSHGGATILDNGALVHKACHPKSAKEVAEFAGNWNAKLKKAVQNGDVPLVKKKNDEKEPRPKRGRPKVPLEERFVAQFLKLGLSAEQAREAAQQLLEPEKTLSDEDLAGNADQ